ncbi:uncharacterized protein LOC128180186 [Crassostrea angulata]|uniref:uncharacterized protein LOC128180186 n=1 Tax=Magallana angulata TaxID=2784310 RepID=UPI0022B1BADC|nr:uncharacterized protein LOC128180186 [Crassostrea angulata]XP_052704038.1 uncharacterized protein LOC128180186 [Crassostrea angulata]
MDASNGGDSAQFEVYEDPVNGLENQNRASSASNPVYSLAKPIPPDYELLSHASTLNDPVATETQNSETLKSSGYEELGAVGPQNPKGYEFVDAIQAGPHEYELVSEIAQTREKKVAPYEGLIKEYSFDVTIIQTPDVKELNLTRRYKLILGNLSIILRPRVPLPHESSEPEPIYTWYYADIRRYSFSKQMREFAIYCGRNCPTPEKIICFRVKTDLVQLLQVVNEKTGGAFEAELASIKVKKRVCVVS